MRTSKDIDLKVRPKGEGRPSQDSADALRPRLRILRAHPHSRQLALAMESSSTEIGIQSGEEYFLYVLRLFICNSNIMHRRFFMSNLQIQSLIHFHVFDLLNKIFFAILHPSFDSLLLEEIQN